MKEKLGKVVFVKHDEKCLILDREKWAITINALSSYYNQYKEKLDGFEEGTEPWIHYKELADRCMSMIMEIDRSE